MATPASSATSPSPPMAYLSHAPAVPQLISSMSPDAFEREQRKKAVQKFLARAEISMVTRALRARLSYASYKATHNIPHVPLRELEAQSNQSQAASFTRTIAAKRKASGVPNYYNNPSTPGPSSAGANASTIRRGGSGSMLPPSSVTSPRSHYPSINGQSSSAGHGEVASSSRNTSSFAPNLYTSILAPPPTKQARTIHNVHDPPVPAPSRPAPSPRARPPKQSPKSDARRSHGKGRQSDKALKAAASPDRRKAKRAPSDKGKQKRRGGVNVDADGDVDMKAAATLTSLLLHHRPSITGSATSPRSSIDGSETGSTFSYSHFAQSSARTITVPLPVPPPPPPASAPSGSVEAESSFRHQTPPPPQSAPSNAHQTTPRAAPTDKDNEAADLMLFLATSPSPARPNKESKDLVAYRALSGGTGPLRSKGRVLFPTTSAPDQPSAKESPGAEGLLRPPSTLLRGGEDSFTSSISSIGTELGASKQTSPPARTLSAGPGPAPTQAQLLSPPPLPLLPPSPGSPATRKTAARSPKPNYSQGSLDFNIHEFINASPSPSRSTVVQGHKSSLGLRADVGRKLFEEEQMRHVMTTVGAQSPGKRQDDRPLGAGIDLIQS